jgi:hypothetical protein
VCCTAGALPKLRLWAPATFYGAQAATRVAKQMRGTAAAWTWDRPAPAICAESTTCLPASIGWPGGKVSSHARPAAAYCRNLWIRPVASSCSPWWAAVCFLHRAHTPQRGPQVPLCRSRQRPAQRPAARGPLPNRLSSNRRRRVRRRVRRQARPYPLGKVRPAVRLPRSR